MADRSNVDVLVVGAGMAGVCAAVAAARGGARTVLTDRYAFLGGNATAGLLGNFLTFHNMKGEQICNGIPQEIVDELIRLGGAFPEGHLHNAYGNSYSVTPQDGEVLKLVNQKLCLEAGVDLVLNTYTIGPVMDGDRVAGARIVNKSGESEIRAQVVIDASGDADIAAQAGAPFHLGDEEGKMMSISLFSRMGNVDLDRHLQHVKANPTNFMLGEDPYIGKSREEIAAGLRTHKDYPLVTGYYESVKLAQSRGEFHPNRQRVVFSITNIPGVVTINSTSMLGYSGIDNDDLNQVAIEGREQVFKVRDFYRKYAPGFEECYVMDSASAIGVRETRRIIGEETLTTEDCVDARKGPRDIGQGAYCLDVHQPTGVIEHKHIRDGESYGIPYGIMLPQKIENCLVAGRPVSSDRFANGSVRNQAHIMTIGQAAGTAAAMCAERRTTPRELPVEPLREKLRQDGAVV
ncbi:MAG: FAD-dependent oxidoreductase [Nitrospinae bacterium]|nr:FAD-dependent oxidoreductase [Nitrospinota bacterium]